MPELVSELREEIWGALADHMEVDDNQITLSAVSPECDLADSIEYIVSWVHSSQVISKRKL